MSEEEIRLDQTKKVFEAIADIITNGSCTYRYLIYDMLGFKAEHYVDLMSGLTITNAIVDLEDFQQEKQQYKEVIEKVREWLKYKAETLDEFDIPKRKETGAFWFSTRGEIDNLLQILDKVGD